MSIHIIERRFQDILRFLALNINYYRGREYIPFFREALHIENTSICNLKCRFCAYSKKSSKKVSMSDEFFFDCVEQAIDLGYRKFRLTPCTGDVFMDQNLFNKLNFLERHNNVESYEFFTNLTIPDNKKIERLIHLNKLKQLTISIYGHNLDSFVAITQSSQKIYHRLVKNLHFLLTQLEKCRCNLEFGFRSTGKFPGQETSDLLEILNQFRKKGVQVRSSFIYSNWGGYITKDDVKGLNIDIATQDSKYKKGACALLFSHIQVMATGVVNGCACRDVDATLQIGDLNRQPLRDILSIRNKMYMKLISEQMNGYFRPVCHSCDFYKSIYRKHSSYKKQKYRFLSLKQFMENFF